MLKFDFEPLNNSAGELLRNFSRGNITITGDLGSVSSRGCSPDQSVIITLSIVSLLDELCEFLSDPRKMTHRFVGTDSSFQFSIEKIPFDRIRISGNRGIVSEIAIEELVASLWRDVNDFLSRYVIPSQIDNSIFNDLRDSVSKFQQTFQIE